MASKMQRAFEEKAFGKPTIVPRFFEHARKDSARTDAYGITIYSGSVYVEIKTSGRRDTTTREARDEDKKLFHEHYAKYCDETASNFMPMEALAGYSIANRATLRDLGVKSVEELADYAGNLPLASLKLMKHCAVKLVLTMSEYEPPAFVDDVIEEIVSHETKTIQTQRKMLPSGEGLGIANGQEGDHGGGVQRLGVSLSEDGQIIELNGKVYKEEGRQEEGRQEEGRQEVIRPAPINFY